MKIYSHRSDKDVDHLRFDMKMGGVVLNFRRSGEEQTMNPQNMARIIFAAFFFLICLYLNLISLLQ